MQEEAAVDDIEFDEIESESEVEEREEVENENTVDESEQEVSDEITIEIEGEEKEDEKEKAPDWVRELRQKNKEDQRRIKQLEAELQGFKQPEKQPLGKKPTLEEFDYDSDKYESALDSWYEKKREVEAEEKEAEKAQKQQENEWNQRLEYYEEKKTELKVADYQDAEENITDTLDATQQGIIIQGADNPAHVVYALGKNEKKLQELAAIKDPVKFAFTIAKLESQLKVTGKKKPSPEKVVTGSGRKVGAVDSTLERLREEAERTGNYSKVHAYKRKTRNS